MSSYLDSSGPVLVRSILSLKQEWKSARIIWLPSMPFPKKGDPSVESWAGDRNLFSIAATNAWMRSAILEGGSDLSGSQVEVFDIMTMLFSRPDDIVCGFHYVCRDYNKHLIGTLGIDVTKALLQYICS